MLRRPLAVVVLLAHASAVAHLALAAHTLADTGAVVDAQVECSEPNHGSDGISHGHELQREDSECSAVALVRTAARTQPAAAAVTVAALPTPHPLAPAGFVTPPLEVLSVAPKSSPPV